jgi:hypothetical protein
MMSKVTSSPLRDPAITKNEAKPAIAAVNELFLRALTGCARPFVQ